MSSSKIRVPMRYVPRTLSRKDRRRQIAMLKRRLYKRGKFYGRTAKLKSFPHVASKHVVTARRMYRVDHIVPNAALAKATKCSIGALQKIVKKGEGAFYSSGSRPNQSPQSWAVARHSRGRGRPGQRRSRGFVDHRARGEAVGLRGHRFRQGIRNERTAQ